MIQLSPPTQITESAPGKSLENSNTGLSRRAGVEKKDGLGVFAKLLTGLLKDIRNPSGQHNVPMKPLHDEPSQDGEVPEAGMVSPQGKKNLTRRKGPDASPEISQEAAPKQAKRRGSSQADTVLTSEESALPVESALPQEALEAAIPQEIVKNLDDTAGVKKQNALFNGIAHETAGEMRDSGEAVSGEYSPEQAFLLAEKAEPPVEVKKDKAATLAVREDKAEGEKVSSSNLRRLSNAAPENVSEPRSRDKRRERLTVEIRDGRTNQGAQTAEFRGEAGPDTGGAAGKPATLERELTIDLSGGKSQAQISLDRETRPASGFQDILARELHQNLNGDIVRHASILLRDGGEGTIRLSLKPESLGNVKIRLEMAENKIAGHIIVESDEALRAFEREIRSLEQAFLDSGFDGATLEMAVASGGGREGRSRRGREEANFPIEGFVKVAAVSYDNAGETPSSRDLFLAYDQEQPQINMLA
ncbi:MAG: flagellar hook-length control protein FliK [Treponema sp.]|nr:flagellar hook-length control protein FliK [Treponema sp.]